MLIHLPPALNGDMKGLLMLGPTFFASLASSITGIDRESREYLDWTRIDGFRARWDEFGGWDHAWYMIRTLVDFVMEGYLVMGHAEVLFGSKGGEGTIATGKRK